METWSTMYYGPIKEIIGTGALAAIGEMVAEKGVKKVLLITDRGVMEAGHPQKAIEYLTKEGIDSVVYDKIQTDPLDTMVREALKLLKEEACDGVLAVGGGSSMDVAKAVSAMFTNPGDIMDYTRHTSKRRKWTANRIPLFLVTTTSGTGSEQSPFAVITNTELNRKCNVVNYDFHPDGIILYAKLTVTLNKKWTISCGFDALAHLCDGITVKAEICAPNKLHDVITYEGIRLCYNALRQCAFVPQNLKAREELLIASDFGGMVLSAGTGATHGLGNVLSKYYHIPHGETVGILLPYVMEYNLPACPDRYAKMAEAMCVDISGMSDMEAGRMAVHKVKELIRETELPMLSDYMKPEDLTDAFIEESIDNTCNFTNARDITLNSAKTIFERALAGV